METLLRETGRGPDGTAEYRDLEISAERLTIGSAPDRNVQLLGKNVEPQHAELRMRNDNRFELVCRGKATVRVNGEETAAATLSTGDHVDIGGNQLVLFDPPAGFDAGFQITRDSDADASEFERAFRTDLNQVWLSKRAAAWTFSIVVVMVAFVVPYVLSQTNVTEVAALPFVPDDSLWSSGPLLPAHELTVGNSCSTCHQVPFQRVQDDACLSCHGRIEDHVEHDTLVSATALGPTARCASCHREHNEPEPHIVIRADAACTECHRNSERLFGDLDIDPVAGFSEETHPEFDAYLYKPFVTPAGTGLRFDWQSVVEPVAGAKELSNLKFPHETHLDPTRVTDQNSGEALHCGDCHRLSLDREHFIPITMQTVCIACHELTFDPEMPDRQLPHGQPLEVMLTLEGQYLRKFSDPAVDNKEIRPRRIPDRDDGTRVCVNTAFACATEAAADDIREQFTVRGCVSCHIVEEHAVADIYSRYQVHPVRLATDYFPPARFNHSSHLVMRDKTGDAACTECHEAHNSSASTDLLIPDIGTCVACHSDVRKSGYVPLQCIDCHAYHPDASRFGTVVEADQP
jgi:predicted CXXCH cytochrome family protein